MYWMHACIATGCNDSVSSKDKTLNDVNTIAQEKTASNRAHYHDRYNQDKVQMHSLNDVEICCLNEAYDSASIKTRNIPIYEEIN